MDFKIRPSGSLLIRFFVTAACVVVAFLNIFLPVFKTGLLHYNYILYSLMSVAFTIQIYRELYFTFSNKTVLSINENYIHDYYNDVIYKWSDVEGIRQKHGYLYLKLYHPEEYLDKIGNLHYRWVKKLWYKPGGKHNEFLVNISLADAGKDELSKLLNEHSINTKS